MKAKNTGPIWMKTLSERTPRTTAVKVLSTIGAKPSKSKPSTTNTNRLTAQVIKYLEWKGHFCSRIQSQGQYHPGRGRWIKSKVKRGIGDIIACIEGKFVMIEIKYGKDKQSEYQKAIEKEVEKSGGDYLIVKTINDLLIYLHV
jgi:hypothetical protein